MSLVDIEGVKIQFKNITMFTWSTTVKSEEQMYLNKNETYYKFKYPIHIFRSEKLISKGKFVRCPEHDHVNMVDHGQQSTEN